MQTPPHFRPIPCPSLFHINDSHMPSNSTRLPGQNMVVIFGDLTHLRHLIARTATFQNQFLVEACVSASANFRRAQSVPWPRATPR